MYSTSGTQERPFIKSEQKRIDDLFGSTKNLSKWQRATQTYRKLEHRQAHVSTCIQAQTHTELCIGDRDGSFKRSMCAHAQTPTEMCIGGGDDFFKRRLSKLHLDRMMIGPKDTIMGLNFLPITVTCAATCPDFCQAHRVRRDSITWDSDRPPFQKEQFTAGSVQSAGLVQAAVCVWFSLDFGLTHCRHIHRRLFRKCLRQSLHPCAKRLMSPSCSIPMTCTTTGQSTTIHESPQLCLPSFSLLVAHLSTC